MFPVCVILNTFLVLGAIQLGDSSLAALIAAGASLVNGFILIRAQRTQKEIKSEVVFIKDDTIERRSQIGELRSLSVERMRHIQRLERIAERMESAEHGDWSGEERRRLRP